MKKLINRFLLANERRSLTAQLHHIDETRKAFDRQEPVLRARIKHIHAQELNTHIVGRAARGW